MKTGFYWYRYRQIAQQNRLKNVETDWGGRDRSLKALRITKEKKTFNK